MPSAHVHPSGALRQCTTNPPWRALGFHISSITQGPQSALPNSPPTQHLRLLPLYNRISPRPRSTKGLIRVTSCLISSELWYVHICSCECMMLMADRSEQGFYRRNSNAGMLDHFRIGSEDDPSPRFERPKCRIVPQISHVAPSYRRARAGRKAYNRLDGILSRYSMSSRWRRAIADRVDRKCCFWMGIFHVDRRAGKSEFVGKTVILKG
jgi:hypothetical protein